MNLAAFISYVIVTTFTPGPNNIMSMSNAGRYGFRESIAFNFGVFFGFFIIIAICSAFSVTLYSFIPAVRPVMTIVGAAYILWLAWKTYNSSPDKENKNGTCAKTNTFMAGLLLQFFNPKVIIYGITTVSTFIVPCYNSMLALTVFSVLLAFIGFVATCCWALFGSLFQRFLLKNEKAINGIMAILLIYCSISLFF